MTAYSDFKKYEAVLAHCQSSANSELYRNAEDYGKAAGFLIAETILHKLVRTWRIFYCLMRSDIIELRRK